MVENQDCFCCIALDEDLNYYKECLNCNKKLCELCLGNKKSCECEGIIKEFKKVYLTRGDISFEICTSHSSYQCHFYCLDCKKYVCIICVTDDEHEGHKNILIEKFVKLQKENIEIQKKNLENVLLSVNDKCKELDLRKKK